MLKILYIIGTGSKYSDIELRWSLRSVEKFAQCDVQPVVVGSVPDWFKGDALPCSDKFERKEMNLNYKDSTLNLYATHTADMIASHVDEVYNLDEAENA